MSSNSKWGTAAGLGSSSTLCSAFSFPSSDPVPGPLRSQPVPGLSLSCSDSLTTPWWEIKSKSNLWDCSWIDSAKYPLLQLRDELWYTLNCISKTVGTRCMVCFFLVSEFMVHMLYIRDPQPPGHGPVPPVRSGQHQIRNKVQNKCNVLDSFWNPPPPSQSVEKLSSMKPIPGAKKVEDRCRIWWTVSGGVRDSIP